MACTSHLLAKALDAAAPHSANEAEFQSSELCLAAPGLQPGALGLGMPRRSPGGCAHIQLFVAHCHAKAAFTKGGRGGWGRRRQLQHLVAVHTVTGRISRERSRQWSARVPHAGPARTLTTSRGPAPCLEGFVPIRKRRGPSISIVCYRSARPGSGRGPYVWRSREVTMAREQEPLGQPPRQRPQRLWRAGCSAGRVGTTAPGQGLRRQGTHHSLACPKPPPPPISSGGPIWKPLDLTQNLNLALSVGLDSELLRS